MHIRCRNINDAFRTLVHGFAHPKEASRSWGGSEDAPHFPVVRRSSRNGDVLMIDEPVIVTYEKPRERVLFNQARDANPFMHVYEALWMLAGRNDVAPLAYYAKNMLNYSDDEETLNGAYGYRWRNAQGFWYGYKYDQLKILIEHLKAQPDSRRAVLQMWTTGSDLCQVGSGVICGCSEKNVKEGYNGPMRNCPQCKGTGCATRTSKDVCCNLSALFSIRRESVPIPYEECGIVGSNRCVQYLDMTVFNRSNDLIWGMLGANVVHFSVLQEYMAAHIGVEVGVYNQVSNNLHIYLNEHWKPEEYLEWESNFDRREDPYEDDCYKPFPLVKAPAAFDEELIRFVEHHKNGEQAQRNWDEPFLNHVADSLLNAFHAHKRRQYYEALGWCDIIEDAAWQYVARKWIEKRKANWEKKGVISE